MAFRLTPEEYDLVCERIALSGLGRQEYIYRKLMDMEVVVQPSVRVHKALKDSMAQIYQQLLRIRAGDNLDAEMEAVIQMLAEEFNDLKPAEEEARVDQENQSMWNLERN
ncbi:hypothetical protein [Olsenella sp. oral taxon 809]|uniref:plasmid mobilization protein n=1 Tax=Olsenella sp. oral taxon 809 TaxID=661086 RepID=UPI0002DD8E4D|nr:hypothetical protein [Olsenella sp. oral taxon 809]